MTNLMVQIPKDDVEPAFPSRDEQLHCELEKMNKNGKFIFYTHACQMLDPLFIVTSFTDGKDKNALAFQVILGECIVELEKTAKLTNQLELKFLHVGMTELTDCNKCIEKYGSSFHVKCFHLKPQEEQHQGFALVSLNMNSLHINSATMEFVNMEETLNFGINALLEHGILVIQVGSLFHRNIQDIIWKLMISFEQVKLVKPSICSPHLDIKYLICCGYRRVQSVEVPSIHWYYYLNSIEHEFTTKKNVFQRRACDLAKLLIVESTGIPVPKIDQCLLCLSNVCAQDENIRKFGTLYYQHHKLV